MISKSVEYAIKSLVIINCKGSFINVEIISEELNIPKSFTSKILKNLVKKEYILSQRGPGGGFSKNDYKRTLKELIIDIDGDFKYDKCALRLSECSDLKPCPLHDHFKSIKSQINDNFMQITIDKICENPNKILKL